MTTLNQRRIRSALQREAERLLEPQPSRGDYILACVGVVGCVVTRWAECRNRDSVICWRALSHLMLAYSRIEVNANRFAVANDLLTLSELAQQHAADIAPAEDKEIAA